MHIRTSNANHFAASPQANIPRSSFNRSHGHKTTFFAGDLVPVYVDEVLPGDTFNCRMTGFARLATPIFPIMDNMVMDSFFFFVPNRLIWENWQKFNGEQDNPGDSTDYVLPTITSPMGGYTTGSLFDYFQLPTLVAGIVTNSLPLRAYNLIYNEWFRDENLQNSVVVQTDDGPDTVSNYVLLKRGKRYDYFTSALPFPQKGPAVDIPLGSSAPVISDGGTTAMSFTDGIAHGPLYQGSPASAGPVGAYWNNATLTNPLPENLYVDSNPTGLIADLTSATAATINQLRQAFQVQKLYERDARGGTRYTEIIRSHFGVVSPDMRLQRPEYLGGGFSRVNITPVAQTSSTGVTGSDYPQGNLAAFGTASLLHHGFTKSFTEHGIIIGLVSVRADYTYWQGANRMWFRSTRFDYYWPVLSHLGEQAIQNQEIYAQGSDVDQETFGYQERYAEYRYKPSCITGLFRPNATGGSLDAWHLAQDFGSLPLLNSTFITENPPMSRIKAVTDQPDFIFDSYFDLKCARPMPVYSVPGMIDHF